MSKCHLYLPENDLALAVGLAQYTPPTAAWQLHMAGEALPLWYGEDDDLFYSYGINDRWLTERREAFGIDVDVYAGGDAEAAPWGWSAYTRRLLRDNCPRLTGIPDDAGIAVLRALSHRRTSVAVNERLGYPAAREVTDPQELCGILEGGRHFLKQPWSSSGRGNIDTLGQTPEEVLRQASGVIRRQGSIMVEPWRDGLLDFALLLRSEGGKVRAVGWSLFSTVRMGEYAGNVIAPQEYILHRIHRETDPSELAEAVSGIEEVLTDLAGPHYRGYMGVDMMAWRDEGGHKRLCPCVELNLRMTMGVVALQMARRHVAPGRRGLMRVVNAAQAVDGFETEGRRLLRGRLVLSPPSATTAFVADINN